MLGFPRAWILALLTLPNPTPLTSADRYNATARGLGRPATGAITITWSALGTGPSPRSGGKETLSLLLPLPVAGRRLS